MIKQDTKVTGAPIREWYYQNYHPRSSLEYFYTPQASDELREGSAHTRRFSLLMKADMKNVDDLNTAVAQMNKRKADLPIDHWAAGVDFSQYGGINPHAIPPLHVRPPYSSYNYRELRCKGKTVTARRNAFRNKYEAATIDKGWRAHFGYDYNDQFENEEDEEKGIEFKEEFPPMWKLPKPKKLDHSDEPVAEVKSLEVIDSVPSIEDARKGIKYESVAQRRNMGVSIDDIKLPPTPLWKCLQYNGDRATDRLGARFKTIANKRHNAFYPDPVPDLRRVNHSLKKPGPIKWASPKRF